MSDRIRAYTEVCQLFGFLVKLEQLDEQEIIPAAENLVSTYKNDLEESITDELVQFSSLLCTPIVKQSCSKQRTQHVLFNCSTRFGVDIPKCRNRATHLP